MASKYRDVFAFDAMTDLGDKRNAAFLQFLYLDVLSIEALSYLDFGHGEHVSRGFFTRAINAFPTVVLELRSDGFHKLSDCLIILINVKSRERAAIR